MGFWETVQKDLQQGLREGIDAFREGAVYLRKKAEILTDEGKRQFKLAELRSNVQRELTELGGAVYDASGRMENPLLDRKVKASLNRVRKLEATLTRLQGPERRKSRKGRSKGTGASSAKRSR